jgi:peptide/nickel transport system substrate-binding protein
MLGSKKLSHRVFPLVSLLIVMSMLLVACGGGTDTPAPEPPMAEPTEAMDEPMDEPTDVPMISMYNEAPMLADMVAAGDLPPVEDRLPVAEDIQVITPVDSIGEYGGTWFNVTWGDDPGNIRMVTYDPPVRWKPDYTGYEPGLVKAWEYNADGTELTWHFREGVKWSDGEPFTMEDMKFWWEDLANNPDIGFITAPWWGFDANADLMTVTFPDDYTMVMNWGTPQWITTYIVAQGFWEWEPMMRPKHFLSQFHPTYNADADPEYTELDANKNWFQTPGYPTLFAWYLKEYTAGESFLMERNPYYWKVDTEGNQLPYIDFLDITIVPEKEVRVLELSQGKYDASFRGTDDPLDIPFLIEQSDAGNYEVGYGWMNGAGAWPGWLINQDYVPDEEIRELLRNVSFRKGLSVAIDRDRLIDVVWDGIGTPQQATISPQSWHFAGAEGQAVYEAWQQADAEYDPALAMTRFDEIGFVDADGDGWRDLPSGKAFELVIDLTDWGGAAITEPSDELIEGFFEAVGVNVVINNVIGSPESGTREKESSFMLRNAHASEVDIWTYPDWIFPLRGGGEGSRSWPMAGKWKQTGGAEGWEPEAGSPAQLLQALYDKGKAAATEQERHEIVWEAIQVHIDYGPFTLGAAGDQPMPVVIKNTFHNVPRYGVLGPWAPGSPGNTHAEQYWIEQ